MNSPRKPPSCDYCPSQYVFIVCGKLVCWQHATTPFDLDGEAS